MECSPAAERSIDDRPELQRESFRIIEAYCFRQLSQPPPHFAFVRDGDLTCRMLVIGVLGRDIDLGAAAIAGPCNPIADPFELRVQLLARCTFVPRRHGVPVLPEVFILAQKKRLDQVVFRCEVPIEARLGDTGLRHDKIHTGADAVINCAGPFLDTALPIVGAALRAKIPYLDVTAEQPALQAIVDQRDAMARAAGVTLLPAAAFYGGLADLLVTAGADASRPIERVDIAVGLDSWQPTRGTRVTGERNRATRMIQRGGVRVPLPQPAQEGTWSFPEPIGERAVVMLPFTEALTVSRHLPVDTIESWFVLSALRELRDPNTPPPKPSDERGALRSTLRDGCGDSAGWRHASRDGNGARHLCGQRADRRGGGRALAGR